jgi:hypothetical protein
VPTGVLINIARRVQADQTNIDMQANGAQKFAQQYGDNNLKAYQQLWNANADTKIFEVMNIYKDIHPLEDFDRYKVKSSAKKDTVTKLMADITFNLHALDKLLETIQQFRGSSQQEMQAKLLHSGTLDNDLAAIQGHIQNEVQKYKNILHTKLTYFTDLLEVLNQQLINSKIYKFINTAL